MGRADASPTSDDSTSGSGFTETSTSWNDLVGIPDVLMNLGSGARSLLRDPRGFIVLVILEYLTGAVLDFAAAALRLVLRAFGLTAQAPVLLANSVLSAFRPLATLLFGLVDMVVGVFSTLIASAGPAAPLILALLAAAAIRLLITGSEIALNSLTTLPLGTWARQILTLQFLRGR